MSPVFKIFLLGSFFIGACSPSPVQNQASVEEMRKNYSGEVCGSLNGENFKECKKKCDDIYRKIKDRNKCEKLEVSFIEDLYETYKILEKANDLDDVDFDVFTAYISINPEGIEALEYIIEDYSSGEAKKFLIWLIENREIAEVFRQKDDNYHTLETLFKEMDPNYDRDELWKSFTKKRDGEFLMEIIISEGEDTVNWFMDFINEKNPDCADDTETIACFTVYCEIGDRLDDDVRESWLEYEQFEKYINKIIDEKVNSQQGRGDNENLNGWIHADAPRNTRDQIGDKDDLDEDWVKELCIGGII